MDADSLRRAVEGEARSAAAAAPRLTDESVTSALGAIAALVRERKRAILAANEADMRTAKDRIDPGALDRLRLDERRLESLGEQAAALSGLEPLDRVEQEWTLANGLTVSRRRIPIGVVGANFEARPNVALDVAGQLLKSLNGAVLRTGAAALGTVTVLVDDIVRPALERAGIAPSAIGLVRSPEREGARMLVSMPHLVPLVILRGSGPTTGQLARLAAEHGVRTIAHAEGGGVLYLHPTASSERALAIVEASLDRLGVCNRLNLALVDRGAVALLPSLQSLLDRLGVQSRGSERALAHAPSLLPLDRPLGHEWAGEADRVGTVTVDVVDDLDEAVRVANDETSGLAAAIVAEDEAAAGRFLEGYRGTAAFWNAPTRFADGFELTGAPETGINVDSAPGPRGPVTYSDLWLRQYRVVGDGTQRR